MLHRTVSERDPVDMFAPAPMMGLQRSQSVNMSASQAAPAPMMGLQRSLSVDMSASQAMPQLTTQESQMLQAALMAYEVQPSDTISWQMRDHLLQKITSGRMSSKPKKQSARRRRGTRGPSKLSKRRNATNTNTKKRKNSSNSNTSKHAFPSLNSISGNEGNAVEMRF